MGRVKTCRCNACHLIGSQVAMVKVRSTMLHQAVRHRHSTATCQRMGICPPTAVMSGYERRTIVFRESARTVKGLRLSSSAMDFGDCEVYIPWHCMGRRLSDRSDVEQSVVWVVFRSESVAWRRNESKTRSWPFCILPVLWMSVSVTGVGCGRREKPSTAA